jgi:DNA-binding response OmpR family regulator
VSRVREIEGLELVANLRERVRAPIIVSFNAVGSELRSAFKNGATYYLPLPFEPQGLAQVVGKALVRSRKRRRATLLLAEREVVEIELPTDTRFVGSLADYLVERTAAYRLINPKMSNLFVALDEALARISHQQKGVRLHPSV